MEKQERLLKYLEEHPTELARMKLTINKEDGLISETVFRSKQRTLKAKNESKDSDNWKRATEMFDLYKQGDTYEEISNAFCITRERVRQIIVAYYPEEFKEIKQSILDKRKADRAKARMVDVKCSKCEKVFKRHKLKLKVNNFCSKECSNSFNLNHIYPDWANGRSIQKKNFTVEEWREINRIRASDYYHRHRDRLNAKAREWRKNNKERFNLYHKRSHERKIFGEVLYTELPNPINIKAMKP